jgi:hypothetical protein
MNIQTVHNISQIATFNCSTVIQEAITKALLITLSSSTGAGLHPTFILWVAPGWCRYRPGRLGINDPACVRVCISMTLTLNTFVQVAGLRIGGLSGIFDDRDYRMGHFEHPPFSESSMRSAYHVREYEVAQLNQVTHLSESLLLVCCAVFSSH